MRPYFMRQLSTSWFNGYLVICGALLNLFAIASFIRLASAPATDVDETRRKRARVELEDARMCTQHMQGRSLKAGEFSIRIFNVGSSRVDLQACKLEYSIVSPK